MTAKRRKTPEEVQAEEDRKAKAFRDTRRQTYEDQIAAAGLVRRHIRKDHRICKCKWMRCADQVELHVNSYEAGNGKPDVKRATYKGLVICGNVWGCPVCGARVSRVRRQEMNTLMAWARAEGLVPVMLTLTARHGRKDRLADLLDSMKNAKRRLRQRDEWRRLPFRGSVTATEITQGDRNGWHPHFHEIVLLEASDEAEALTMVQPLADAWRVSLRAFGLDGAAAAFDAQGAASAGDYIAKWGVAEEMTLRDAKGGKAKKGADKGRIPIELARMAAEGSNRGVALWLEYFEATSLKRRRQLVWTPGLKAECGLQEVADEDAAAQEIEDGQESVPVASFGKDWDPRKRVLLMEAAERGGSSEVMRVVAEDRTDADLRDEASEVVEDDLGEDAPPVIPEAKRGSERAQDAAADDLVDMLAWLDRVADAPPDEAAKLIAQDTDLELEDFRRRKEAYDRARR